MPGSNRIEKLSSIGLITAVILGLYLSSLHSYLLFHGLVEISTIAIAFTLFILTWNARGFLNNDYLKILGIGYAFIAFIDMLHTLAYKGMSVFPGYGANLPTQLWIAARYLQAVTLCAATLFVKRRADNRVVFGGYAAAVTALVTMVYSGNFPDCFIEGKGLTLFKIGSEYVITALLLASLYLLHTKRKYFNDRVFFLTVYSIACTVLSEISFTAYVSVYGFANMAGHFAKLAAFYFIYRAILVTGIKEPFELIFRDLKQAEEALRKSQDTLEEKVRERTDELRASEERYRSLILKVQAAIVIHDGRGRIMSSNPLAQDLLGLSADQLLGKALIDPQWRFLREDGSVMPVAEYPVSLVLSARRPLRGYVTGISRPDREQVTWALINAEPECNDEGGIARVIVSFVDITERKLAEKALHRLNRELRAISNCNETMMRAEDEQALLNDICRIVCEEAGYRMAWVGYAENDETKTVRTAARAGVEDGYLADADITWADVERGRGPTGIAIRTGKTDCIQDFATEPKAAPWRDNALQRGYRSSIALPLKDESKKTFGTLTIYSTEVNAFTPDEVRLLEELAGNLAYGIMVLRARIERNRAEEALRESRSRLQYALDAADEGLWEWYINTGEAYLSPRFYTILGYKPDEFPGSYKAWISRVHPDDAGRAERAIADYFAGRSPGYDVEIRMRRKDGRWVWTETHGTIVEKNEDGNPGRMVGTLTDIAERKQAEEKIRKLNEELERRVQERTAELEEKNAELESVNKLFVGRELRMIELKEKIRELENKLNPEAGTPKEQEVKQETGSRQPE